MSNEYTLDEINMMLNTGELILKNGELVDSVRSVENTFTDVNGDRLNSVYINKKNKVLISASEVGVFLTNETKIMFLEFVVKAFQQLQPSYFTVHYGNDYIYTNDDDCIVTDWVNDRFSINPIDINNDENFYNLILTLIMMKVRKVN